MEMGLSPIPRPQSPNFWTQKTEEDPLENLELAETSRHDSSRDMFSDVESPPKSDDVTMKTSEGESFLD